MMTKLTLATLFFFFTMFSPLSAGPTQFFPLQVGNQWIYRVSGAGSVQHRVAEVVESAEIDGREYFLLNGFGDGPAWLRLADDGTLYSYSREQDKESAWVKFSANAGDIFQTSMHPCSPTAKVEGRDGRLDTPAGSFSDVFILSYPQVNCADAGLSSDAFAPSVGLVERTLTTFAGPQTLSLVYARLDDKTVLSDREVTFGLSLDRAVYTTRLTTPVLTARITLRVRQPEPLELTFPSGQRFDLELVNEARDVVHRWSDGRAFTMIFGSESFGPGEKNWMAEVPLVDQEGNLFPPGKYTARCWLTTVNPRQYSASVGFEISADR